MHIAVLDFGSQYTHLIARRVRELGVQSFIYPHDVRVGKLKDTWGIIMSGGPNTVNNETALSYDKELFDAGKPILGLCYSHQLIADHFGGQVVSSTTSEYGKQSVHLATDNDLFAHLLPRQTVWMSHADSVLKAPEGFVVLGMSDACPIVAMGNPRKRIYSTQFHVEVNHTPNGLAILKNFIFTVCEARQNWNTKGYLEIISESIRKQVGDKNVLLLVSGGVDSTVCFALLNKVLGKDRVYGMHMDTGFMRKDESTKIHNALADAGFDNLHVVQAQDRFFDALAGIIDPEEKRKRIGDLYLHIKDEEVVKLKLDPDKWMLAQGTIYPDTIESGGTKAAHKIKTHHNRSPKVLELLEQGTILEPLAELYKDEVRELGNELGLTHALVHRHPFPGPGLAIRALCTDGNTDVAVSEVNTKVDDVLTRFNAEHGTDIVGDVVSVKSVGVQGDFRTYRHPVILRTDADWDVCEAASTTITNSVNAVNRAILLVAPRAVDFTEATIHPATLTKDRITLLQEIDAMVEEEIRAAGVIDDIWQFPVVLVPFGIDGKESVVLRPFESKDVMTLNVYHMEKKLLQNIVARMDVWKDRISYIFYDLTHKPPGTVEWE